MRQPYRAGDKCRCPYFWLMLYVNKSITRVTKPKTQDPRDMGKWKGHFDMKKAVHRESIIKPDRWAVEFIDRKLGWICTSSPVTKVAIALWADSRSWGKDTLRRFRAHSTSVWSSFIGAKHRGGIQRGVARDHKDTIAKLKMMDRPIMECHTLIIEP